MNDRDQTHEYLLSFGNIHGLSGGGITAEEVEDAPPLN